MSTEKEFEQDAAENTGRKPETEEEGDVSVPETEIQEQEDEGTPELEFDVKMSSGILYDYLLRHAYSSAVGIIGSCFGAMGIIFYASTHSLLYLVMGIVVLLYLPLTLFKRSKMVMLTNPSFKKPLTYRFYEKGFTVSQDESKSSIDWSGCTKAVSTKKSIIVYTGKNNASIFPREQIPGGASALTGLIAKYMDPRKVKIRY